MKKAEILQHINKDIFRPKDTGLTYTVINYWDKLGVLVAHQEVKRDWRNFSFVEYLWLTAINELRVIGMPLEVIKKVKDKLYNGKQPVFHSLVLEALTERLPVRLLIFPDGNYARQKQDKQPEQTHVALSVNNLIKLFLCNKRVIAHLNGLPVIHSNEVRLLELIHAKEYDKVTINYGVKSTSLVFKRTEDTIHPVVDAIVNNSYKVIELRNKGMLTKVERDNYNARLKQ